MPPRGGPTSMNSGTGAIPSGMRCARTWRNDPPLAVAGSSACRAACSESRQTPARPGRSHSRRSFSGGPKAAEPSPPADHRRHPSIQHRLVVARNGHVARSAGAIDGAERIGLRSFIHHSPETSRTRGCVPVCSSRVALAFRPSRHRPPVSAPEADDSRARESPVLPRTRASPAQAPGGGVATAR